MKIWTILLAAGEGKRIGTKKQYIFWKNRPLFWHSVYAFSKNPLIKGIIFVVPKQDKENLSKDLIPTLIQQDHILLPYKVVAGGATRQESVYSGLTALPPQCTHVLIHDSARPFVNFHLVNRVVEKLEQGEKAVVPGVLVTDTIKIISDSDKKVKTLPRKDLRAVQTPQGFEKDLIIRAHEFAIKHNILGTDDASLIEEMGEDVSIVEGDISNIKITHKEDLKYLEDREMSPHFCIGYGYDVHRYGQGKPLKLGGVLIPNAPEVIAHSDGDVVVHAIIDAILGCLAKGDIGELFPDTDNKYKDINSFVLLSEVMEMARKDGFKIDHIDITIVCERPKVSPYKREMIKNIAPLLNIKNEQINIKATTEEGLGFTGELKGIKAKAVVIGRKYLDN